MVTNGDLAALSHDWRLPPKRQRWLQSVRQEYAARYSFDASGTFNVELPGKIRNCMPGGRQARSHSTSFLDQEIPAQAAASGHQNWTAPAARTHASSVSSAPPSPQVSPVPHPPVACELDETQLCRWSSDTQTPPAGVLWLPGQASKLGFGAVLCVLCEEKSTWLYPYACELFGTLNHYDNYFEMEDEQSLRPFVASRAAIAQWSSDIFGVIQLTGGPHNGIRAVGIGNNKKCRSRAAKLGLAATVRALDNGPWQEVKNMDDPESDARFYNFVQRVRGLFGLKASEARDSNGDGPPPPPPPPGPAPLTVTTPPPPPSGNLDVGNIMHKLVVAIQGYQAESDGYLALRTGDKVLIKWEGLEPPSATDHYSRYAFGQLLESSRFASVIGFPVNDTQGWFPFDLVQITSG